MVVHKILILFFITWDHVYTLDRIYNLLIICSFKKYGNSKFTLSTKVTLSLFRLNSLANSFFQMLQQLEKTVSPFSEPQLAHHKIEYLKHIITVTLEGDREKFIR